MKLIFRFRRILFIVCARGEFDNFSIICVTYFSNYLFPRIVFKSKLSFKYGNMHDDVAQRYFLVTK